MIKIICDTQNEKTKLKIALFRSDSNCIWYNEGLDNGCPEDSSGQFIGCDECIEKYIDWEVKKKNEI